MVEHVRILKVFDLTWGWILLVSNNPALPPQKTRDIHGCTDLIVPSSPALQQDVTPFKTRTFPFPMVRFYPDMNLPHTHTEIFSSQALSSGGLGETVKVWPQLYHQWDPSPKGCGRSHQNKSAGPWKEESKIILFSKNWRLLSPPSSTNSSEGWTPRISVWNNTHHPQQWATLCCWLVPWIWKSSCVIFQVRGEGLGPLPGGDVVTLKIDKYS